LTPQIAIAAIPPPEAGLEEAKKVSGAVIDTYNAGLPALAKEAWAYSLLCRRCRNATPSTASI
jgi:hypothetical protein